MQNSKKYSILNVNKNCCKAYGIRRNSIYSLIQTRLCCVSIRLKIGVSRQILVEAFCIKIEENLSNAIMDFKNTPFLALQKLGFIVSEYG